MYSGVIHNEAQSTDSGNSVTIPSTDTTGKDIIWLFVVGFGLTSTTQPTDNKGNTYLTDTSVLYNNQAFGRACQMWYCQNPTVGTGHTFNVAQGSAGLGLLMMAATGSTTSPLDQRARDVCTSDVSSLQIGSVTPTQDNEIIVVGVQYESDNTAVSSADSGFTVLSNLANIHGTTDGGSISYKIQTTAGAENPTITFNQVEHVPFGVIATFKAASGGGVTPTAGNSKQFLMLMGAGT